MRHPQCQIYAIGYVLGCVPSTLKFILKPFPTSTDYWVLLIEAHLNLSQVC